MILLDVREAVFEAVVKMWAAKPLPSFAWQDEAELRRFADRREANGFAPADGQG